MEMDLIKGIAATGLMGLVAALFIYIAFDRDKKLFKSLAERIADNGVLKELVGGVTATLNSIKISIDNRADMTTKMEETLRSLAAAQVDMASAVNALRTSQERGSTDFAVYLEKFDRLQDELKIGRDQQTETLRRLENLARRQAGGIE